MLPSPTFSKAHTKEKKIWARRTDSARAHACVCVLGGKRVNAFVGREGFCGQHLGNRQLSEIEESGRISTFGARAVRRPKRPGRQDIPFFRGGGL